MKINNWEITESSLNQETYLENNTIFSIANGYVGTRGNIEETISLDNNDGTFINGFHDTEDYVYPNSSVCQAKKRQKMLFAPQAKNIDITINQTQLNPEDSANYSRTLDMRNAVLTKTYDASVNDIQVNVTSKRFASMECENMIIMQTIIKPSANVSVKIESPSTFFKKMIVGEKLSRKTRMIKQDPLHLDNVVSESYDKQLAKFNTDESNLELYFGVEFEFNIDPTNAEFGTYEFNLASDQELVIVKKMYYNWTNHSEEIYNAAMAKSFAELLESQNKIYDEFWAVSDITLDDPEITAAMRFNVFSLFQNTGRNGITNVCAKGLTGEGYDGHYFWDTEIFVLPYFTFNKPEVAKSLLMFRYNTLEIAKERAAEIGYDGALFPWRTINGTETSPFFPAGSAQVHINADIAYALLQYVTATNDQEFMKQYGAEMLTEIAKFYIGYADFNKAKGWGFNGVTGPDEYTALGNHNTYTNLMVKKVFTEMLAFKDSYPVINEIADKLEAISSNMYIPRGEGNLIEQCEGFLSKELWPHGFDKMPLLSHYHPMVIYKYQIIKQADLILAMGLLPEYFTAEEIKSNYDYYNQITTHDSSLSKCSYGQVASFLGYNEQAYEYFDENVKTDLFNTHANTADGVHIASQAGSWQTIAYGFAGMKIVNGQLSFQNNLPSEIKNLAFSLYFHGQVVKVSLTSDAMEITTEGNNLNIIVNGEEVTI